MALGHSPQIVRDGLVLYLDAANLKSYPGSGTSMIDLKNNTNCSVLNSPQHLTNNSGVFSFDATNERISIPQLDSLNLQTYTYCFWIKRLQPTASSWLQFLQRSTSSRNPGIWFYINEANRIHFSILLTSGSNTSVNPSGFFINEWHYFSGTVEFINNTTFIKGYTDGVLNSTATHVGTAPTLGTGTSYIGDRLFEFSNLTIYNKALSAEEIKQNFNALRGRFGI